MKKIYLIVFSFIFTVEIFAARITNVTVDMVKGFTKVAEENGDTSYYYMGRVTYNFFAEEHDSIVVDFAIVKKGTDEKLQVALEYGDIGFVKQKNPADTIKTFYFRTKVVKDISGEYVGKIIAVAEKSKMWKLADSLVKRMTLEQRQMTLYNNMTHPIYKYFGQDNMTLSDGTFIVGWRCADGPHGIRYPLGPPNDYAIYGSGDTVTLFPTEAALGCSWDTSLVYRIGAAIGKEGRAKGVYCNLGPMADLVINPRWGRAFETMGEDPFLNGKMVASQVRGLQSVKTIACPKHFVPYVMEKDRGAVKVLLEERALRELFCEPFRMAIEEGGARAIMTCYHRVRVPNFTVSDPILIERNCERAGSNRHLIHDILRNDWGFDGIVMTDWDGAEGVDPTYAYETEFDMSMPQGKGGYTEIAKNIKSGVWQEEFLNRKAKRIMYGKLWAWDGKLLSSDEEIKTFPQSIILCEEHKALTLEAARKTLVLVKNDTIDGAPVLPLNKNATLRIAVRGPYAKIPRPGGGGSSAVTPDKIVTIKEAFDELAKNYRNITITESYDNADVAVVCVGVEKESEDYDRETMQLSETDNKEVENAMKKVKKTIVVYTGGSASAAGAWSKAPAILVAFYPGRLQGTAIREAIFGDINPGGHLAVTFPQSEQDLPPYKVDENTYILRYPSVDSAHGYFWYEKTGKKPLFWFGHGLSYTTFKYEAIRIRGGTKIKAGDRIDVIVTVANVGEREGDEVVQLYVKPQSTSQYPRRVKDLRGFTRITLKPQERKNVMFTLGPRDFSIYIPDPQTKTGRWSVIPGEYDIIVGSTSDPEVLNGENGNSVIAKVTVIE